MRHRQPPVPRSSFGTTERAPLFRLRSKDTRPCRRQRAALLTAADREPREDVRGHAEVVLESVEKPFHAEAQTGNVSRRDRVIPTRRACQTLHQARSCARTPGELEARSRTAIDEAVEEHRQ